jgi:hypothetical protein
MQRRAVLRAVGSGEVTRAAACDAHRELVRAGTHIGAPAGEPCPVCGADRLRHVRYVFTGRAAKGRGEGGRAIPHDKWEDTLHRLGDVKVYLVEVCIECRWHHLLESYWHIRDAGDVRRRTTSG